MERKDSEFSRFNKVMDGLLAVPYEELQRKLAEKKESNAKRQKRTVTSVFRASRRKLKKI